MTDPPPDSPCSRWRRALPRLAWLNPAGRIEPADPLKELRFTRAAQAGHFVFLAILCACAAFALLTLGLWPWHADGTPFLPLWWPGLLPLAPMAACLWLAAYCTSHAYVILSPVGVEIFPLWFPTENFRLIPWPQIQAVRADHGCLVFDFGADRGGVVLSLRPLRPVQRELLFRAASARCGGE